MSEGLADDNETGNHKDRTDIIRRQTGLRLVDARMAFDVTAGEVVVEEMAPELADGDGDERREVDVADAARREAIAACDARRFEED